MSSIGSVQGAAVHQAYKAGPYAAVSRSAEPLVPKTQGIDARNPWVAENQLARSAADRATTTSTGRGHRIDVRV